MADGFYVTKARLRIWQWLRRCDCVYGMVIPSFEEDNAACRIGLHGDCPGGHLGVRVCPKHVRQSGANGAANRDE